MMSLEAIQSESRKAAVRAAMIGEVPFVPEPEDIEAGKENPRNLAKCIPFLGELVPKGWEPFDLEKAFAVGEFRDYGICGGDSNGFGAFFVDASGMGSPGEAALTANEFVDAVAALMERKSGLGLAVVQAGQFQVKVGVFRRNPKANGNESEFDSDSLDDDTE